MWNRAGSIVVSPAGRMVDTLTSQNLALIWKEDAGIILWGGVGGDG